MTQQNTSVSVSFEGQDTQEFGGGRLIWEAHNIISLAGHDAVRLYPGSGLTNLRVRANIGTVRPGSGSTLARTEVVQFSGSTVGATKYPVVGGLSYRTFGMLFDRAGNGIGGSGSTSVSVPTDTGGSTPLTFRGTRNGVEANVAIYGHMEVTYNTSYRIYNYEALIETIPSARGFAGVRITKGFLAAFENGNVATYEVPLSEVSETEDVEVYRVVSEAVLGEDGAFEKPVGWTGLAGSPTWPTGTPDPSKVSLTHERVHEAAYLTASGRLYRRTQSVRKEEPKQLSPSYRPVFTIKVAQPGEGVGSITAEQLGSTEVQKAIATAEVRYA